MDIQERRTAIRQLTSQLRGQLNMEQQLTFKVLEGFGWGILFIRRPPFKDPIVVLSDGESISVLEKDGTVNDNPNITLRDKRVRA